MSGWKTGGQGVCPSAPALTLCPPVFQPITAFAGMAGWRQQIRLAIENRRGLLRVMFHDLIILAAIIAVSYVGSTFCFAFHPRAERFETRMEWWKAEGMMLFFTACVGLLILAVAGHLFHSLR
jgi:hypothetical protein